MLYSPRRLADFARPFTPLVRAFAFISYQYFIWMQNPAQSSLGEEGCIAAMVGSRKKFIKFASCLIHNVHTPFASFHQTPVFLGTREVLKRN